MSLVLVATSVGGCAPHQWAPGPAVTGLDLGPTQQRRWAQANSTASGYYASGSIAAVAAVATVGALANAIHERHVFDACMQSSGFMIADGQRASMSNTAVTATALPPPGYSGQPLAPQTVAFAAPPGVPAQDTLGARDCAQPLRANQYYEPLLSHLPDSNGNYSAAQLSDDRRPTQEEIAITTSFDQMARPCLDQAIAEIGPDSPIAARVLQQAGADHSAALSRFQAGNLTWGEYAALDQQIHDSANIKLKSLSPPA